MQAAEAFWGFWVGAYFHLHIAWQQLWDIVFNPKKCRIFYADCLGKRTSQTKINPIWRLQKYCVLWVSSITKKLYSLNLFLSPPEICFVHLSLRPVKYCIFAGHCAKWCYLLTPKLSTKVLWNLLVFDQAWTPPKKLFCPPSLSLSPFMYCCRSLHKVMLHSVPGYSWHVNKRVPDGNINYSRHGSAK